MGFAKFMEDNEQLYIERQIDHGVNLVRPGGFQKGWRPKEEAKRELAVRYRYDPFRS